MTWPLAFVAATLILATLLFLLGPALLSSLQHRRDYRLEMARMKHQREMAESALLAREAVEMAKTQRIEPKRGGTP